MQQVRAFSRRRWATRMPIAPPPKPGAGYGFWNTPRLPLLPDGDEDLRRAIFEAIKDGKARLVDKDGVERKAISPSEINLSSSGLRIAKPHEDVGPTTVVVPDVVGKRWPAVRLQLENLGLVPEGDIDGTIATQFPQAGASVESGSSIMLKVADVAGPTTVEHQVSITVTTSLADDAKRDPLRLLFNALANAVDESASHVQMTVKITLPTDAKDDVVARAGSVTPHVSITDL